MADDLSARVNDGLAGFDTTMGFRMVRATPDEVVVEYVVQEKHLQPYGIVHGGVWHVPPVDHLRTSGRWHAARHLVTSVLGDVVSRRHWIGFGHELCQIAHASALVSITARS